MIDLPPIERFAVDGGGTRCRIAAVSEGGTLLVETGSANVSTDFQGAVAALMNGFAEIADRVGAPIETFGDLPVYAGLAGITGPGIASRLTSALPFRSVRIADDRPSALRGALGTRDGVVLHCGTGSFGAAQIGGRTRFAGGWGAVLGDEASAQWVGRQALSRSLDALDDIGPASDLTDLLLQRYQGGAGIVAFAAAATPADLGELARDVTRLAATGDGVARAVLRAGADYLSHLSARMGWAPGLSLCLTGGIGAQYAAFLPEDMQAHIAEPLGTPLDGALALAEDFERDLADERR